MSIYLGENLVSGVATPMDGSIAIGQIISSIIPLTDAGLHLLDGTLIQGDGIYDDFVQYIANLVNLYPQCFCSEADWQGTVNAYGACGKFVYDSTNNTVRLPKITGFIEGTVDSNALGELVGAGLPNITGIIGQGDCAAGTYNIFRDGAFYATNQTTRAYMYGRYENINNTYGDTAFDASRSSSIYGNSNTVQPQAIKVFYYIVIATTTKTDIEVDIDEVITDLNTIDSNAVHKTGNETITGIKTFTSPMATAIGGTYINYASEQQNYMNTAAYDSSGKLTGEFDCYTDTSGTTHTRLIAFNPNNSSNYSLISASVDVNGDISTHAPTPTSNSNDYNIATTYWVNNRPFHRINSDSNHFEFILNGQDPNYNPSYPGYYLAFEDVSSWQKIMSSFNFQVVSTLPASPNGNVYYFIPE